jgi:hypothetical protein
MSVWLKEPSSGSVPIERERGRTNFFVVLCVQCVERTRFLPASLE